MHREERYPPGEQPGHVPKGAAPHQQTVGLDHARQRALHVGAHVQRDRPPEHVEYSGPLRATETPRLLLGAVVGCLRLHALRELHTYAGGQKKKEENVGCRLALVGYLTRGV